MHGRRETTRMRARARRRKASRGMARPRPRGASLLEIVMATLIISVVAIELVEFFAKGRVWFDQEEHKRVATLLAQDALERTTSLSYAEILTWSETRTVDHLNYAVSVTVQDNTPDAGVKTVRSAVTWQARPAVGNRTVSLATMRYNN